MNFYYYFIFQENEGSNSESEEPNVSSDREIEARPPVFTYTEEEDLEQEVCSMRKCPNLIIKELEGK